MKFLRILGHTLPFLILLSIILLITLPFNSICIEVLYVLNFCFALYIFLYTHVNKKIDIFFYARIIQVFCVLTCAAAIATTRCFLSTTDLTKQIPFVLYVYAKPFVQTLFSKNNELSSHRFCLQSVCYQTCFVNFIRSFVAQPLMNPFTIEELYKFPETFSQFLCA